MSVLFEILKYLLSALLYARLIVFLHTRSLFQPCLFLSFSFLSLKSLGFSLSFSLSLSLSFLLSLYLSILLLSLLSHSLVLSLSIGCFLRLNFSSVFLRFLLTLSLRTASYLLSLFLQSLLLNFFQIKLFRIGIGIRRIGLRIFFLA